MASMFFSGVVATRVVLENRQRIVVIGDRIADMFRQTPGLGGEITDNGMIGVQQPVLGVDHPTLGGGVGIRLFEHLM